MYLPSHFGVEDQGEVLDFLRATVFGHLVTSEPSGLMSTALPFLIDDDLTTVRAHVARANNHWRTSDGNNAIVIIPGVDAYVSPRWYPSKAEHGKVVPTWNYEVVHLHGTIEVHDDSQWTRKLVEDLTNDSEEQLAAVDGGRPWGLDDAPAEFIDGQLKAIVGLQLNVSRIEAKRKLSQNRSDADREGAITGLTDADDTRSRNVAARMEGPI